MLLLLSALLLMWRTLLLVVVGAWLHDGDWKEEPHPDEEEATKAEEADNLA